MGAKEIDGVSITSGLYLLKTSTAISWPMKMSYHPFLSTDKILFLSQNSIFKIGERERKREGREKVLREGGQKKRKEGGKKRGKKEDNQFVISLEFQLNF